jgi:hypothetical protein
MPGVAACVPGVTGCGEPVGRLTQQGRFTGESGDASLCVSQLVLCGGDVALEVGQPSCGIGCPGDRPERVEPFLAPAVGVGQCQTGPLTGPPSRFGRGVQCLILVVVPFGGPVGGGVERPPQRWPVVEPVGHPGEPLGVGGEMGQVRAPPVGPAGQLLTGVGDGCALTNGIAGWMTSGDGGDVGQLRVAEEAPDDLR